MISESRNDRMNDRMNDRLEGNGINGGLRDAGASGISRNDGVSDQPQKGRSQQQAGAVTS